MRNTLILIFLFYLFTSCCFYESGPSVTINTPETRLSNKWELQDLLISDKTDYNKLNVEKNLILEFQKNGDFFIYDVPTDKKVFSGKWNLDKKNNILQLNFETKISNETFPEIFNISRLTKNELWITSEEENSLSEKYIVERRYVNISR